MRKQARSGYEVRGATAASLNGFPPGYRYHRDVLPSGLRVVTVEAPHLHTAMLAVYVRTGSRHESAENNGVSHFLEHMFFRGSTRHPDTIKMNAAVEAVGGNLNGVTTRDHGYYFTPIHPAHLKVGIDILGDMLTHPLLTKMNVEREIILEEMLDEVDEKGRDIDLDNLSKMQLFPGHPLSLKIAGTRESVRAMNKRQLNSHYARHYVCGNLVVAASGRVHREQVLELAERAFRDVPPGPQSTEQSPEPPSEGPTLQWVKHDESQTELRLSFVTVPEQHPDYPALQIIRRVLDDGLSSRLPFEVVERRGLAYSVHAGTESFHDTGLFEIDAASAPRKAALVVDQVCQTVGQLCERDVTLDELHRAARRHRMFLEFAQDSTGDLAGWFGGTELFRVPESFEQRCAAIENLTPPRVRQVARRYFHQRNLHVTAVGPSEGSRALAQAVRRASGLPPAQR